MRVKKLMHVKQTNTTQQGIDLSDQMSSYHSPLWKTIRWLHKLAMELVLGIAVVNAHCLYNAQQRSIGKEPSQVTVFQLSAWS